jgi:hypothetical protein
MMCLLTVDYSNGVYGHNERSTAMSGASICFWLLIKYCVDMKIGEENLMNMYAHHYTTHVPRQYAQGEDFLDNSCQLLERIFQQGKATEDDFTNHRDDLETEIVVRQQASGMREERHRRTGHGAEGNEGKSDFQRSTLLGKWRTNHPLSDISIPVVLVQKYGEEVEVLLSFHELKEGTHFQRNADGSVTINVNGNSPPDLGTFDGTQSGAKKKAVHTTCCRPTNIAIRSRFVKDGDTGLNDLLSINQIKKFMFDMKRKDEFSGLTLKKDLVVALGRLMRELYGEPTGQDIGGVAVPGGGGAAAAAAGAPAPPPPPPPLPPPPAAAADAGGAARGGGSLAATVRGVERDQHSDSDMEEDWGSADENSDNDDDEMDGSSGGGECRRPEPTLCSLQQGRHKQHTDHPFMDSGVRSRLTWAYTVLSDQDMRAMCEKEALMNTAGCDGTEGPLSPPEIASHLAGEKPSRGISLTLDLSFSLFLAAKKLHPGVQKPPGETSSKAWILKIDLTKITGWIQDLSTYERASFYKLSTSQVNAAWCASEVLVSSIPRATILSVSLVDESTEWLLKIKGNDQGLNRNDVWKFGRYGLYREALDAAAPTDSRWRKLVGGLQNHDMTTKVKRAGGLRSRQQKTVVDM